MKLSKIALILVLVLCAISTSLYHPRLSLDDFKVYYTAASLVREHRSLLIYNGADTGIDPQLRRAEPDSIFAQEAQRFGIAPVRMYVYPPILADLLVPLTYLRLSSAIAVWTAINIGVIILTLWLCLRLLQPRQLVWAIAAVTAGTLTFLPVLDCLVWGQISVVLLGLWTLGVFCYAQKWTVVSALALALATALKLTPLLVVVPILLWKDWRWLRAYAVGLAGILLSVWAVNGTACIRDCITRVIPSMSNGNPYSGNKSLLASLQLLYEASKRVDVHQLNLNSYMVPVPHTVVLLGKILSVLCVAIMVVLLWRERASQSTYTKMVILSLMPLLSTLISPVSWKHAYAVALLPYIVLWAEALAIQVSPAYLALLALCSVEINWFGISYAFRHLLKGTTLGLVFVTSILCGVSLVMYRLAESRRFATLLTATAP